MAIINKGSNKQLTRNFTEKEFYSTSSDAPQSHFIDDRLIQAAQLVRDWLNAPVRITSSFRTQKHQLSLVARGLTTTKQSQHMEGKALDMQPATNWNNVDMEALQKNLLEQGELYQELRKIGITGIGVYDTFIHLDVRTNQFTQGFVDAWGKVQRWDFRKKKTQK